MTKREHILKKTRRVQFITLPAVVLLGAILLWCEFQFIELPPSLNVALEVALVACAILVFWFSWTRIRCPDCGKSAALAIHRMKSQSCPKCGSDWTDEQRAE